MMSVLPGPRDLSLILVLISICQVVSASNDCQPVTWANKRDLSALARTQPPTPHVTRSAIRRDDLNATMLKPGEVGCKYTATTTDTVNYYTCTQLANYYDITVETFFALNPEVDPDCSNLTPYTAYCVKGVVQPEYNEDGTCGPFANNASCPVDGGNPCCNARTWKCGGTHDDCLPENCWGGICPGATIYSIDGFCGPSHGNTICTGSWGACCGPNDCCGNGTDYCGAGNCQYGACDDRPQPTAADTTSNESVDGTCGGAGNYTCSVAFGNCCSADGFCGDAPSDCALSNGCQPTFGKCT